jgi:hypothetical protein
MRGQSGMPDNEYADGMIEHDGDVGKLLKDRTYRVHIDGYNQLPYLTGQEDHSARRGFIYFDDDGQLIAIRYDNWKLVFYEQKTPGTLDIWANPSPRGGCPYSSIYAWTRMNARRLRRTNILRGQFTRAT